MNSSCTTPAPPLGSGNMTNDPLFLAASNLRLTASSPCVNKGNNVYVMSATDMDGNPRIQQSTVDIGAYEFQPLTDYVGWSLQIPSGLTAPGEYGAGDRYPNLLRYAAGSDPTNSDDLAQVVGVWTGGVFALRFNRNTNANDITLFAEGVYALTNGATWNAIATNIHGSWGGATNVIEARTGTPVVVTVQDPIAGATSRFLRLRVTRP